MSASQVIQGQIWEATSEIPNLLSRKKPVVAPFPDLAPGQVFKAAMSVAQGERIRYSLKRLQSNGSHKDYTLARRGGFLYLARAKSAEPAAQPATIRDKVLSVVGSNPLSAREIAKKADIIDASGHLTLLHRRGSVKRTLSSDGRYYYIRNS